MSDNPPQAHVAGPGDDELDLLALVSHLWSRRWRILLVAGLGFALSFVYAITRPKIFTSSILLVPTETSALNQLGAAASLLGKKGAGQADVDLYQSLLVSRTVIGNLLHLRTPNLSDTANGRVESIAQILRIDTTKPFAVELALRSLPAAIKVESDKAGSSGMVEIQVKSKHPWLSQAIADGVVQLGQEEIRRVRAQRSDAILERLGKAVATLASEWDSASGKLMTFRLENRSTSTPVQQREEDRLSLELQSKQQSLLMARNQFQQQLLEREKAAPPMVVLDPANLPVRKSGPKRFLILVVGSFLIGMGTLVFESAMWILRSSRQIRHGQG